MNFDKKTAKKLDQKDPLRKYRKQFHHPVQENGKRYLYFCGNSLGLQPKKVEKYLKQELKDWKNLGVEGHFHAKRPWMPYHEFITESMAKLIGAKPIETVAMNGLTVNLHLMMTSFYRPTKDRYKILMETDAFPSDHYAVDSQVELHGYNPDDAVIELVAKKGQVAIETQQILDILEKQGDEIALVMIGGVNYYTGQVFDMETITKAAHKKGCKVGFDLAHAVGNIDLNLHDWNVDFAVWCTYKYLNSGPGGVAGCFVHERHADSNLPRFAGWWGHEKATRFTMPNKYIPIKGAEGWQLSNAPIFSMASLRASLDIFDKVGLENLNKKSKIMTAYLEQGLLEIGDSRIEILTPKDRGCQLSIRIKNIGKDVFKKLETQGVIADWREPDVIRVAPVPLYNSFMDVYKLVKLIEGIVELK